MTQFDSEELAVIVRLLLRSIERLNSSNAFNLSGAEESSTTVRKGYELFKHLKGNSYEIDLWLMVAATYPDCSEEEWAQCKLTAGI